MDQFVCQQDNHRKAQILGFCLGQNCLVETQQFCLQCAQQNHTNCGDDCVQFQDMIQTFDNIINYFKALEQKATLKFEEAKKEFDRLIKNFRSIEDKFSQFQEDIKKQDYYKIKEKMKCIKFWYKEIQGKKKPRDFNTGLILLQKKNWKEAEQQLNLEKEDKNYEIAQFYKNWSLAQQNILLNEFKYIERPDAFNSDLISKLQTFINYQLTQDEKNVIFLITKGILLECNNEYNGALLQYNQALKQDEKNNYCLYWKCHVLIMLQKYKEAEEIIEQMNKIDSNYCLKFIAEGKTFYYQGYLLYQQNKFNEALLCYDNGLKISPNYVNLLMYQGLTLNQLNYSKKAQKIFGKITQIENNNIQAFFNLGLSLQKQQQKEEAISCFDLAINLNPKQDKVYQQKCETLRELNNFQLAHQTVEEWLLQAKSKYYPYIQKGLILKQEFKYQDAIIYFTKATEIHQQDPQLYKDLGFCLLLLNEFKNSMSYYEKALILSPQDTLSLYNVGFCLMKLQQFQLSIVKFDQVIKLEPQYDKIHFSKGQSQYFMQDYQNAVNSFQLAIQQNYNDLESYNFLGLTLMKLKKYSESIIYFDQIINKNRQDYKTFIQKAHALRKLNQYDEAIDYYDKAIIQKVSKNQSIIKPVKNIQQKKQNQNSMFGEDEQLFLTVLHKKGKILLNQGKYQQALNTFQEICSIDAKNTYALIYGGLSQCKLQNIQDALEKFAQAIEINPILPLAYFLQDYFQKQNDYKPKDIIAKLNQVLSFQIKSNLQKCNNKNIQELMQLIFETLDQGDINYQNDTYLDEVIKLIKKLQKLLLRQ